MSNQVEGQSVSPNDAKPVLSEVAPVLTIQDASYDIAHYAKWTFSKTDDVRLFREYIEAKIRECVRGNFT